MRKIAFSALFVLITIKGAFAHQTIALGTVGPCPKTGETSADVLPGALSGESRFFMENNTSIKVRIGRICAGSDYTGRTSFDFESNWINIPFLRRSSSGAMVALLNGLTTVCNADFITIDDFTLHDANTCSVEYVYLPELDSIEVSLKIKN